jgi:hypothetical protein
VNPLDLELFNFRSVGDAVARELRVDPSPDCRLDNGRTWITFRRLGGTRWSEAEQVEFVTRAVLADHPRDKLRKKATRAIVIVFKDSAAVQGCEVTARWECTVPGQR